jgi:hypothetical protein
MDIGEVERAITLPIERMDAEARVVMEWSAEREDEVLTESKLQRAQAVFAKEVRALAQLATEDEIEGERDTSAPVEAGAVGSMIGVPSKRKGKHSRQRRASPVSAVPVKDDESEDAKELPQSKSKSAWDRTTSAFSRILSTMTGLTTKARAAEDLRLSKVQGSMTPEDTARLLEAREKATALYVVEANKVIDDWEAKDEGDDVSDLAGDYSLSTDETLKPALFPSQLWPYVADSQKPKVMARWARYENLDKLVANVADLELIDICKERTATYPYVLAQAYANLSRYYQVDEENPETVPDVYFRIRTTTEVPFTTKKTPRWAYLERIFMGVKQSDMIRRKQLEQTESPWRSPCMLVPYDERIKAFMSEFAANPQDALDVTKHPENRTRIADFFRFTMNMVGVNAITIPDNHPMPSMADSIEAFQGDTSYSAGDVLDAFWNIRLHPDDRAKTAFATHNMLLQWTVAVQGSRTAANFFARVIQGVFNEAPLNITVFQDDVFVHTKGIKMLLEMQQLAFDRMEAKCLFFKRSKAKLNYPRMKCLGHIITKAGRCPDPSKIKDILALCRPKTSKDIRTMMGLVQFNGEYIPKLADILAPLNDISHDDANVVDDWKEEIHGAALERLKIAFTSEPMLALPDMSQRFRIWVDTCTVDGRGVGGILTQWYGEGEPDLKDLSGKGWRPVAYYSKLMTKSQRRYGVTEAEAMGMHDCIMRWAPYLLAGEFDVIVDHKALEYIYNSPATTANRRILRYALNLQKFTFRVIYKSGAAHLNADAMSRLYQYGDDVEEVDAEPSGNYDIATAEDLKWLKMKVALGTGETMSPGEIAAVAGSLTSTDSRVRRSSLAYRMSRDADFMMVEPGRFLQDTISHREVTSEDEYELCPKQGESAEGEARSAAYVGNSSANPFVRYSANPNVRQVVNEDVIWEDPLEVHYVNLDWQDEDELDTDGDEPTHQYVVNRLTGATEYVSLAHQHQCRSCTQVQRWCADDGCQVSTGAVEIRAGAVTRLQTGRHGKKTGRQLESLLYTAPKPNVSEIRKRSNARRQGQAERAAIRADQEMDRLLDAQTKEAHKTVSDERVQLDIADAKAAREATKVLYRGQQRELAEALFEAGEEAKRSKRLQQEADRATLRQLKQSEKLRLLAEQSLASLEKTKGRLAEQREYRRAAKLRKEQLEAERRSAAGLGGPKKVILLVPRNEENETGSQRQDREEGDQLAATAASELVGGLFQHPSTGRVYEVMYVFWDPVSGKIVANRRSADGAPSTSDDNYSYEVEGVDGIRALSERFQEYAGFKNRAHRWPRSEAEMRMLQIADPVCKDLIERCEAGEECRIRKHRVYTMPLVSGAFSALRIDISGAVQAPAEA